MADWKAVIVARTEVLPDRIETVVMLTDGTQKITRPLTIRDPDADLPLVLGRMAQAVPDAANLEKLKLLADTLQEGASIPVVIPDPPPPPDPPSAEKQAWVALVFQLARLSALSPTHKTRADLQQQVDDTFQPEFLA